MLQNQKFVLACAFQHWISLQQELRPVCLYLQHSHILFVLLAVLAAMLYVLNELLKEIMLQFNSDPPFVYPLTDESFKLSFIGAGNQQTSFLLCWPGDVFRSRPASPLPHQMRALGLKLGLAWGTPVSHSPFCSPCRLHPAGQEPSSRAGALPAGDAIPATTGGAIPAAGRALGVSCAAHSSLGQGRFCCLHWLRVNVLRFSFTDLVWNWKFAFLGLGLRRTFYSHTFFKGIICYMNCMVKSLGVNFYWKYLSRTQISGTFFFNLVLTHLN